MLLFATGVGAMGLSGWRRCPLVAKVPLALAQPSLLIRYDQCIQVVRSRACIVHPVPEQRTAVDDIDGELALLVLVGEIAPERIVGIQPANSFESERLDTPGLERLMIVVTFRVNLHAIAQLADMFVKRGFEPAIAQAATTKPLRRKSEHLLYDRSRIDIGSAEHFERSRGAAPFRERRAFEHHRARIGARHEKVWRIGTRIDPCPLAERPTEPWRRFGAPALHLDNVKFEVELEEFDEPAAEFAEGETVPHRKRSGADEALPPWSELHALGRTADRIGPVQHPDGLA